MHMGNKCLQKSMQNILRKNVDQNKKQQFGQIWKRNLIFMKVIVILLSALSHFFEVTDQEDYYN